MASSDLVTMWLLCLNLFEFEMSDRIFFKQEFASTADLTDIKQVYDSILDAIDSFKNVVDQKKVQLVVNQLLNFNKNINIDLIKVLVRSKFISKNNESKNG